jgi:hypothetical protein
MVIYWEYILGIYICMDIWYIPDIFIEWYTSDFMNIFMGIYI